MRQHTRRLLGVAACALLLGSCATTSVQFTNEIPNNGLLIAIEYDLSEADPTQDFFRWYQIEIVQDATGDVVGRPIIRSTVGADYAWISGLEPGSYTISRTKLLHEAPERNLNWSPAGWQFAIEEGSLTVFEYKVVYTIFGRGMRDDLQRWVRLTPSEEQRIREGR